GRCGARLTVSAVIVQNETNIARQGANGWKHIRVVESHAPVHHDDRISVAQFVHSQESVRDGDVVRAFVITHSRRSRGARGAGTSRRLVSPSLDSTRSV